MSERLKTILFVHPSDELYGADRCLLDIITRLPAEYRPVVVLPSDIPYSGALSSELSRHNVRVEKVDMLVLRRSLLRRGNLRLLTKRLLFGCWTLARICRQHHVRIVHSNTIAVPGGAIAAMITGTPHIWHIHEHIGDEPAAFKSLLRLMLMAMPGRIIANSKATARAIVAGNRRTARKTTVVYNGVSVSRKQQAAQTDPKTPAVPRVVIVGRLTPRKGITEALQAARELCHRGYHFQMAFVGDVPPGQTDRRGYYEQLVVEYGITDSVAFLGEQQHTELDFNAMDILLAPSQRPEGFGLTIIEAMANHVPVVAIRNGGGSDELLDHMQTGVYCQKDPQSIANGVASLIDDPGCRVRLAANAFEDVQRRFSLDRYQRQIARLYRQLS